MITFRLINMSQESTSTDEKFNSTRVNIRFTIALAVPAGKFYQRIIRLKMKFFFSIELLFSLTLIDDVSSLLALCLAVSQDEQGFHCVLSFFFSIHFAIVWFHPIVHIHTP
jgi:hypothetical protein